MPAGLATTGEMDGLGARLRRIGPRHDAVGDDLGVEPGWAVRIGRLDDRRPRGMATDQTLDRRRTALAHLRPAGDHDEVHHARPGADMAIVDVVAVGIDLR